MHILVQKGIGIFRKIPLKNNVERLDGTKSSNRAKITNISVSENYKTSKENGYEVIKILPPPNYILLVDKILLFLLLYHLFHI